MFVRSVNLTNHVTKDVWENWTEKKTVAEKWIGENHFGSLGRFFLVMRWFDKITLTTKEGVSEIDEDYKQRLERELFAVVG